MAAGTGRAAMRFLLVMAIYGLGALIALRSVAAAGALFLWSDIFQPLSFAKASGAYPVAQYVFAVLVGAYLWHLARGTMKPRFGAYFIMLSIFLLWVLITVLVSPFRDAAVTEYVRYLKYLLPLLLINSSIQTPGDAKLLAGTLAASVGIWGAQAGLHCLLSGPSIDIGIPGGQMTERNDLTAGAVGTVPMLLYFAFAYRGRFRRPAQIVLLAAAVLNVCAIFLSLSRGSSIGFFVTLIFYVALVSRKRIRDSVLVAVFVALAFLLAPRSWYDRMSTINLGTEQTETSAQQRMEAMTGAFHATLDRPIFGWGPDGWLQVANIYTTMSANPHNIYLKLSSEVGVTGLVLYLAIMFLTYRRLMKLIGRAKRVGDPDAAKLSIAIITCIIGMLSALTFLNAPLGEYLWALVSVANALPTAYERKWGTDRSQAGGARPGLRPKGLRP
jgi:probable O-glycosylation ligase (exosortase A-associated)